MMKLFRIRRYVEVKGVRELDLTNEKFDLVFQKEYSLEVTYPALQGVVDLPAQERAVHTPPF